MPAISPYDVYYNKLAINWNWTAFIAGSALAGVLWVPGNPWIFKYLYKEPTEGNSSSSGDAKIGNPRIEIPNDGPANMN